MRRFKEKKSVNLIGPQFSDMSSYSGKYIAIRIYANLGLVLLSFEQLGKFLEPRVCTRLCSRDSNFDARRVLRQRNLTVKYCNKVISTYTLGSSGYIFFFLQEFTKCFLILRSVKRLIIAVCVSLIFIS